MASKRNSELIDEQVGRFSVLGLVTLRLAGPYFWQSVDINDVSCKGTAFHAYESDDGREGESEIASITVADATDDPTEPDVSHLDLQSTESFDDQYRQAIQAYLDSTGMALVRWMPSQLKDSSRAKVLCTAYVATGHGNEQYFITARTRVNGRNVVAIGAFDDSKKYRLAAPIFYALHQAIGEGDPDLAWQALKPFMTRESPREILQADFMQLHDAFPIRGGWGHTKADACVIDKDDPIVDKSEPFNGVAIEYAFVEKRIYEEMIVSRPPGEAFSGIEWKLQSQRLVQDGDRRFDHLIFDVTAYRQADWNALKADFEGSDGASSANLDSEVHARKRQEKLVRSSSEFWFDVTSFVAA